MKCELRSTQVAQLKLNRGGKSGAAKTPGVTPWRLGHPWVEMPSAESLRNLNTKINNTNQVSSARPPMDALLQPCRQPQTSPLQWPDFRRTPPPSQVFERAASQERHAVLPGSRFPVPARRGALRPPSAGRRSIRKKSQLQWTGCGPATQSTGPRLGKEQKQQAARIKSPLLNSSSNHLGLMCMARTL